MLYWTLFDFFFILAGVALLPFVDENRLKKALMAVYSDLTEYESECLNAQFVALTPRLMI